MYDSKNNDNNILQTLKASSALFPYFPSIKINNFDYIDGGIHANCPTQFLNNIGQVDSIIISSTRAFNESIKLNCSTKIKRVIDMLLFSQLINDLKLIQKDISKYNSDLMTHIGPINPDLFKTVYFINPSGPLKNDTTQISEKNSKHDFSLGVTDAKNFIDNSMKYDIESMVFQ
ncbi:MAG TPA: hypothetical protein PLJ39_04075 [Spirochaetota bacterium]|nr:hypothetical protein [Spirochaetota bacterium]